MRILAVLLKETGLAPRLGLLLLWGHVPWVTGRNGSVPPVPGSVKRWGRAASCIPGLSCSARGNGPVIWGVRGSGLPRVPPSQETLGNGGSGEFSVNGNGICFAQHFILRILPLSL